MSNDRVQIAKDVPCGNAQGGKTEGCNRVVALLIASGPIAAIVRPSVDLDRQPRSEAGEIEAVAAERVLAAEDQAAGSSAEGAPEPDFGGVAGAALSAGEEYGVARGS